MKLTPVLSALCLLLPAMAPTATAQEPATQSAPAPQAEPEYVSMEQLRSFYKLLPQASKNVAGVRTVANAGTALTFGPGNRELSIGGYRWQLSYPVKEDISGDLLISKVDMVKLIDPVLRPTYISDRRLVRTIVLDPGHGGYDSGTITEYANEVDYTLQLALELKEALSKRGHNVVLTRTHNRHVSPQQRVAMANEADAPIFISLHLNSGRSDIRGIETYCAAPALPGLAKLTANKHDAANAALAFALHSSLIAATGATDGACRRAEFNLLNSVDCPAVLLQLGYATHKEEATLLTTPEYRAKLVAAITDGVSTFARAINPDATIAPAPEAEPEPPAPQPVAAPAPAPSKPKTRSKAKPKPRKQAKKPEPKKPDGKSTKKPAPAKPARRR
ncbi:MAG: N-acetylmuramoyl-L-alanine amidase [Akkermansia sp.]|nr:N-acetylmuramoyl-L-alanine amidase [Akkermansia sp.]